MVTGSLSGPSEELQVAKQSLGCISGEAREKQPLRGFCGAVGSSGRALWGNQ